MGKVGFKSRNFYGFFGSPINKSNNILQLFLIDNKANNLYPFRQSKPFTEQKLENSTCVSWNLLLLWPLMPMVQLEETINNEMVLHLQFAQILSSIILVSCRYIGPLRLDTYSCTLKYYTFKNYTLKSTQCQKKCKIHSFGL